MNALLNQPVQESPSDRIAWDPERDAKGRIVKGSGGRPKGVQDKVTRSLKEAILEAAKRAGDNISPGGGVVAYLQQVAETAPQTFMPLLGRVLPLDVTSSDGSMRPVVALYMPDNRRDAKLVQDVRPAIDVEPAPAVEADQAGSAWHASRMPK